MADAWYQLFKVATVEVHQIKRGERKPRSLVTEAEEPGGNQAAGSRTLPILSHLVKALKDLRDLI